MITRILLDMDDVLNDFHVPALRHLGCPVDDIRWPDDYPEVGYDIVRAANVLLGEERYTIKSFWNSIPRSLWATLPKSDIFGRLLLTCETLVGREGTCIATSPTLDPECCAGKLEWIQKMTPPWLHRQFLIGPCKHFLACNEALLIDDSDKNVNKFREHGGHAILVPRPWNSARGDDVESTMHHELKILINTQRFKGQKHAA